MSTNTQLDIQKIESTVLSLEKIERVIVGSDGRLDVTTEVRDNLIASITNIRELVDIIESYFNIYTQDAVDYLIIKAFPCLDLAKEIVKNLHAVGLAESLIECIEEFNDEVKELYEIIVDLSRYKSSSAESDESFLSKMFDEFTQM